MEIKEFYSEFISRFNNHKKYFKAEEYDIKSKEWTEGISNYIKKIFEQNRKYTCICKNKLAKKEDMKEFLSIDFTVFNNNEKATLDNLSNQIILYAIEHENNLCSDRIAYNISKLLNVKAENKIMIGYAKDKEMKNEIFKKIELQLKNIPEDYFRKKESLLVILGSNGMSDSSEYNAILYDLKSKTSVELI